MSIQTIMQEQEGVIKYQLHHQHHPLGAEIDLLEINAWRSILFQLKLIGQRTDKYGGLGFGNISRRLVPSSNQFVISGSQTGQLAELNPEHYVLIQRAEPDTNSIYSRGLYPPSSEALTHASVYQQDADIQAVIHVHSPELWHNTLPLKIPYTHANIAYGTTDMAQAVANLFISRQLNDVGLFSMLGHEDGIVAFGPTFAEASTLLIKTLIKSRIEYPYPYR
ncbi:class II aldolase/adducin family protein [Methylomonas sp. AM2-LC]|uniref:class II aldolase/adducin family protein n=1 Tax=Methylomonas sp. AM2-LC TaxID=3153301 RepID=UPI003267F682